MNKNWFFKYNFHLVLVVGLALTMFGCKRDNNPLIGTPSTSINGLSLFIPQIETQNSDINRIFVLITDETGTAITGSQLGNWAIVEGGNPGVPFEVGPVTDPLYIVLVIDRSGSMSGSNETAANAAATDLVNSMANGDVAAVVDFESTVSIKVNFTSNKGELIAGINSSTSTGGTAFYDAMVFGAGLLQTQQGRRLLIGLSDGEDNASTETVETVIQEINSKGMSAYPVGLGSGVDRSPLERIANDTGGISSFSDDGSDLSSIFLSMLNRFSNLEYIRYRRRSNGGINVFLSFGGFTAAANKNLD